MTRDLFGAVVADAPATSSRRAPVRSRAPSAHAPPPAPAAAPPSAPREPAPLPPADDAPPYEHLGLTREEWDATLARIKQAPRVPGAAHTAFMLREEPAEVIEARRRAWASRPVVSAAAQLGGISAAEPDPVDPADLTTCTCGLVVHRASMRSHLEAAERGVPWSTHAAALAGGSPC